MAEPLDILPEIKVADGRFAISMDLEALIFALLHCPYADRLCLDEATGLYNEARLKITDKAAFLGEFVRQLQVEAEDGTTLVHRMLDTAFEWAVENGAEGIEVDA